MNSSKTKHLSIQHNNNNNSQYFDTTRYNNNNNNNIITTTVLGSDGTIATTTVLIFIHIYHTTCMYSMYASNYILFAISLSQLSPANCCC